MFKKIVALVVTPVGTVGNLITLLKIAVVNLW